MDNIPAHHPSLKDFMPSAEEGTLFRAGVKSAQPQHVADALIIEALQTVYDPELPINIYDLGLIYGFTQDDYANISIEMTLTAPACPVAGILPMQVAEAVAKIDAIGEVSVTLTWQPSWHKDMMSEDAKLVFDF